MIPKLIHLCWFSNDPYPVEIKVCLDTWKRFLPDYEVPLTREELFSSTEDIILQRSLEIIHTNKQQQNK